MFNSDKSVSVGLRIAVSYAAVGVFWILFSDGLVNRLALDNETVMQLSMLKGFAFVGVTALTIFILVVRRERRLFTEQKSLLLAQRQGFITASEASHLRLEGLVKQRTEELQVALVQSEDAVQAKNTFLANMGHEIRTPLNAIMGSVHGLLSSRELDSNLRDKAEQIKLSSQTLLSLLNDVLEYAGMDSGSPVLAQVEFDLGQLMHDVCKTAREDLAGKPIKVHCLPSNAPVQLKGDPDRLRLALGHYLDNAIKFTEHGEIKVSVEFRPSLEDGWGVFRFGVRDTGMGVAPEILPKLFSTFVQGDPSSTRRFGGTGLGLAIVQRVAHLMGGETGVESRLGEGSFFWFSVRLAYHQGMTLEMTQPEEGVAEPVVVPDGWPDAMAQIEGLNLQRGFDVARGQYLRYLRLLKIFADSHHADVSKLRMALQDEQGRGRAIEIAHALKGVAGNLGAKSLFTLACKIVDCLRDGVEMADLQADVDELDRVVIRLIKQIRHTLDLFPESPSSYENVDQKEVLDKLQHLLTEGDMSANELVREQIGVLSTVMDGEVGTFVQLVESFDYTAALALLVARRSATEC